MSFDISGRFQRLAANRRPLVIAHRGASGSHPENTLPAFLRAIELGSDLVELDLRMTRDGHIVVIHDASVDRTTNGKGLVAELTLAQIKALDAGFAFSRDGGKTFPFRGQGITVPTLEDVLAALPEQLLMLEVKVGTTLMIRQVIATLRRLKALERVSIELFSITTKMAKLMRSLEPKLTTGHTRAELVRFVALAKLGLGWRFRRRGFAIEMPPRRNRLAVSSKRTLKAAARRGIPMFVWTVNNEKDMRRFLDWGAAGLFTDHPEALRKLVDTGLWDKQKS